MANATYAAALRTETCGWIVRNTRRGLKKGLAKIQSRDDRHDPPETLLLATHVYVIL